MTSMSSRAIKSRQFVQCASQPSRAAAAATFSSSRPQIAAIFTCIGRSNTRFTVRQACECAAPMKAYPTMPTRRSVISEPEPQIGAGVFLGDGLGGQDDLLRD